MVVDALSLIPMPVSFLADKWKRDPSTIRKMCRDGQIPGAHKRGGEWFFYPAQLIGAVDLEDAPAEGFRDDSPQEREVPRAGKARGTGSVRASTDDVRARRIRPTLDQKAG